MKLQVQSHEGMQTQLPNQEETTTVHLDLLLHFCIRMSKRQNTNKLPSTAISNSVNIDWLTLKATISSCLPSSRSLLLSTAWPMEFDSCWKDLSRSSSSKWKWSAQSLQCMVWRICFGGPYPGGAIPKRWFWAATRAEEGRGVWKAARPPSTQINISRDLEVFSRPAKLKQFKVRTSYR